MDPHSDETPADVDVGELRDDPGDADPDDGRPEPRRRGPVVAATVLVALVLAAGVAIGFRVQAEREQAARATAEQQAAAADLAGRLGDLARLVDAPAAELSGAGPLLAGVLEEHVVTSQRSDARVDVAREAGEDALRRYAGLLDRALELPAPGPDPALSADEAAAAFEAAAVLRAEAAALADETVAAVEAADRWGDAVRAVTAAFAAHAEVAADAPESDAPEVVAAAWASERPSLEALRRVALATAEVPGLEAWAQAYVDYADEALAWIDEAVELLREPDVEAYNTRLAQVVDDDPFDLGVGLARATPDTLAGPTLVDLRAVGARADRVELLVDGLVEALRGLDPTS